MNENNVRMVGVGDIIKDDIKVILDEIQEKNETLHDAVLVKIKITGIRYDVLCALNEYADAVGAEDSFIFQMSALMENEDISPEWFEWLINYHKSVNKLDMGDIIILISSAIDNGVEYDVFKSFFENNDNADIFEIYGLMDDFINGRDTDKKKDGNELSGIEAGAPFSEVAPIDNSALQNRSGAQGALSNPANVFDNLLSVITTGRDMKFESIAPVQENFMDMLQRIEAVSKDLSLYCNNVVREWESDKVQIERLKALYRLQQRILASQQEKINNMNDEIVRLQSIVRNAERSEMRREQINQKISELQNLAEKFPENVAFV